MNTKTIKFDLNKYKLYEKIKAKQGDTKSRFLLFQLLDGSIPFNLKNRSVRAYMIKPDGREIFNDLIVNNYNLGYCTLELTNQVLAAQGIVKIELMVTEGDKKLTSSVFELEVVKSINSEKSIVSTNEFTALLNGLAALSEYDNYKNSVKEMEINKANKAEVEEKFISVEEKIKNNSEQLEHIEIEKASKVELEVERQRIELLTKVENGQTEGNTELLDLRIASDGLEYESAGRSIRTQINNVNETVSETEILNPTFKSGYISKNGALNAHENYNYSDPIFLKKGEIIKVQTKGESGVVSIISETDKNATKYTSLVTDDGTVYKREYLYIATKDMYVCISISNKIEYKIYKELIKFKINESYNNTKTMINKNIPEISFTQGSFINANGVISSDGGGGFQYSTPIELQKNQTLIVNATGYLDRVAIISKFIDNTYFPIVISSDSNANTFKYTADRNCKVVISFSYRESYSYYVYNDYSAIFSKKIDKSILYLNYALFDNGICIGDSVTEGVRTSAYIDKNKSYPKFLSRMMNCNIENGGKGGITAQGWYEQKLNTYDYLNYNFAIIKLGQNGGLETLENAMEGTQTYYYCKIIEHIKETNPNIIIYLLPIQNRANWAKEVNRTIKEIAAKYNIVFLNIYDNENYNVDEDKYHFSSTGENYDVHLNTVGYLYLAKMVFGKICEHIENNFNYYIDFK